MLSRRLYPPGLHAPQLISSHKMDVLDTKSDSDYESQEEVSFYSVSKKINTAEVQELENDFADSSDENETINVSRNKLYLDRFQEANDSDSEDDAGSEEKEADSTKNIKLDDSEVLILQERKRLGKLTKLTPEQLAKEEKKIKRTGVCYLSSIPPYMKPVKLRSVLSRFGNLGRIFMKPEDQASYRKRVKYGGNKKKKFTEGWVEFVKKKNAKLCAQTMNGNIIGGKKSSYYHDDIMNIKYLPGLKWSDLTQQIVKENEERQAKMMLEISQQARLDKTFVGNIEKAKRMDRKRKAEDALFEELLIKKSFDQHDVISTRADSMIKKDLPSNLQDVLSKVL